MKRFFTLFLLILLLSPMAAAAEILPPEVPSSGADLMPRDTGTFWSGLVEILSEAIGNLRPDLAEASRSCLSAAVITLMISIVHACPTSSTGVADLAGTAALSTVLLRSANSLIALAGSTVRELSEYGKLLLPVMTTAMAAQGGSSSAAALYTGSAAFNSLLSTLIANILVPLVYVFLALSVANSAAGEENLKKLRDFAKWLITWSLKIILYIFTGYMSITGVVSGSTDAIKLKAAKLTISGMVPVVGNILSDASEAVLVSTGIAKNAAGIYGLLAVIAVFLGPFLRIGVHYLFLKATGAVCGIFDCKRMSQLIQDFTAALGLLLAMTGTVCLLLLISTVCFLREVGM